MVIPKNVICLGWFPGIHRWINWRDWQLCCAHVLLCDYLHVCFQVSLYHLRMLVHTVVFIKFVWNDFHFVRRTAFLWCLRMINAWWMHRHVSCPSLFLSNKLSTGLICLIKKKCTCSQAKIYLLLVMYFKNQGLKTNLFALSKNSKLFFVPVLDVSFTKGYYFEWNKMTNLFVQKQN